MTSTLLKRTRWIVHASISALLILASGAAYSWGKIVYDPVNHTETAVTAINAIRTEASAATTAIQSIRQTIELVKQTTSIDGLAQIAGLEEELTLYRDLTSAHKALDDAINLSKSLTDNLNSQYGASKFSWKKFMEGRAAVDTEQARALLRKYESANKAIETANGRREKILKEVQSAPGQLAAQQALSAQIDLMIGQNQQMIGLLSTQIAMTGEDKARQAQTTNVSNERYKRYQDQLKRSADRFSKP